MPVATDPARSRATQQETDGERRSAARLVPLVLTGLVLLTLNLRAAVTVVPPLLDRISADVGLSLTVAGILGALPGLAFASAGAIAPPLLRRWSVERLLVGVLVLVAVGQLARPWSHGAVEFLVFSGVVLVSMGVGNVLLPVVVKTWFPTRIGLITSVYTSGLSLGTAIPALIAVPLADRADRVAALSIGWQVSLAIWGLFALAALAVWVLIVGRLPGGGGGDGAGSDGADRDGADAAEREDRADIKLRLYRSRIAWGVTLVFGITSLNFYSLAAWLPSRLTDAGLSDAAAGVQLALVAGLGMPMAMLVPVLMGRVGRPMPMVITFAALLLIGNAGLLLAPATLSSLWSIAVGLGTGGFPLALTLVGVRSLTPITAGLLAGFAQGLGYCLGAIGPVLVGLLHAATGGWTAPMGFLLASAPLLVLGGWLVRHDRTVEQDLLP